MSIRYLLDTDWTIHYLNGNPNASLVTKSGPLGCQNS
jgi:hypothetical protein